jgi:hypothetical protein
MLQEFIMLRKVYATITLKVIMTVEEGTDISEVLSEMEYDLNPSTENVVFEDTYMDDYEITDSK